MVEIEDDGNGNWGPKPAQEEIELDPFRIEDNASALDKVEEEGGSWVLKIDETSTYDKGPIFRKPHKS